MALGRGMRLVLGLLLAVVTLAPTSSEASVWTRESGPARSPAGYVAFCRAQPQNCVASGSGAAEVLTQARWGELLEANRMANLLIMPRADIDQYSREEVWAVPGLFGDCEDYALLKRKWLIQQGWPTSTVLMTVVFDEIGEGHAVLVVRTSGGDFVLDNKTDQILLWNETPYKFVKRQSTTDPSRWVRIGTPERHDVPTAARPDARN